MTARTYAPSVALLDHKPRSRGKVASVLATSGQNPLTSTTYNGFSEPATLSYGSGDSDTFTYDPNTGRMSYRVSLPTGVRARGKRSRSR